MHLTGKVKKLIIIIGESDRVYQRPLYEAIVYAAKKYKISGATVIRGVLSYGQGSLSQSGKTFSLSEDVPMVLSFIDVGDRLQDFALIINRLMDKAGTGGLITMQEVEVLRYGEIYD